MAVSIALDSRHRRIGIAADLKAVELHYHVVGGAGVAPRHETDDVEANDRCGVDSKLDVLLVSLNTQDEQRWQNGAEH
jgi:hypothetical protein